MKSMRSQRVELNLVTKQQILSHSIFEWFGYKLSHVQLCDPMDCSPPCSSVHGILQARILQWVAISFSRDCPDPGIEPTSSALAGGFFTTATPGNPSVCIADG